MTTQSALRYTARLVTRPEEIDGRWHAGRDDLDELCRLAIQRRQRGEIAVVKDHETGAQWRVEVEGDVVKMVTL